MNKPDEVIDVVYDNLLQTPKVSRSDWEAFAERVGYKLAFTNVMNELIVTDELVKKCVHAIEDYYSSELKPY